MIERDELWPVAHVVCCLSAHEERARLLREIAARGGRQSGALATGSAYLWKVCARRMGSKSSAQLTHPRRHSSVPMAHSMWMSSGDPT